MAPTNESNGLIARLARGALVAMALSATLVGARVVRAQGGGVIAGTVVEPTTGLPVPNVEVRVLGTTRVVRSDGGGLFTWPRTSWRATR